MDHKITFYTIYESPRDFPGWFVLRPHDLVAGSLVPVPRRICCLSEDIDQLRQPLAGLIYFERNRSDDPCIRESWL